MGVGFMCRLDGPLGMISLVHHCLWLDLVVLGLGSLLAWGGDYCFIFVSLGSYSAGAASSHCMWLGLGFRSLCQRSN